MTFSITTSKTPHSTEMIHSIKLLVGMLSVTFLNVMLDVMLIEQHVLDTNAGKQCLMLPQMSN
jgi:hypothetical protein